MIAITAIRNFRPGKIRKYIIPSDSFVMHAATLYWIWAAKNHLIIHVSI